MSLYHKLNSCLSPKCARCKSVSDLDVLQPVGGLGRADQGEVVFGRHPRLQALQLGGGSVSGCMTHQVALELVGQEVEVDGHRVAHCHVPERDTQRFLMLKSGLIGLSVEVQ